MTKTFLGGWKRQKPDKRDHTLRMYGLHAELLALPAIVDLRPKCSPIVDQLSLSSCTANAGAGLVDYCEKKQGHPFLFGSRLLLYYNTRVKIEGESASDDSGCTIRDTLTSLAKYGICKETTWPYDITKFSKKPSAAATKEALNYKALSYALVDQPNLTPNSILTSVKTQLFNGIPMEFGFDVYSSYEQSGTTGAFPYPTKKETIEGGHAVMSVGYDDTKVVTNTISKAKTTGALLIRNSWGTSWGQSGYGWLPYAYITTPFNGVRLAADFWTLISAGWKLERESEIVLEE